MLGAMLAVGTIVVGLPAPAGAQPRPTVSWTLPATATAGLPTQFSWSARHLPRSSRLVVQRQQGTAHFWRTVITLRGRSGSTALPALALGRYGVRIAAIDRRGRVLVQRQQGLDVFGTVPFSTLFNPNVQNQAVVGFNGNTGPGSVTTPDEVFQYAFGGVAGIDNPAVRVTNNRCRSAHFVFMPSFPKEDGQSQFGGSSGTISIVQPTLDSASATAAFNTVQTLDVPLVPGQPWSMNTSVTLNATQLNFYIYVNGSAVCDSAAPFTSG
jgi:hypothetical protein